MLKAENGPVRILQVVTYMGRGGIETMLMNYYRHMDRSRIQFDFLVHREFRADYDDEIEALGGKIYRMPKLNPFSPSYHGALRTFFREHPYPVVHCHLNYMSGIVLREAKKAGVPVCIAHAHNTAAKKDCKYPVKKLCSRLIPQYADHLLGCGKEAGQAIFSCDEFKVLPNAINTADFTEDPAVRSRLREELGLEHKTVLIHVGRFNYQKNHKFLIEAFSHMAKQADDIVLLCVGDGELRGEITEQIEAEGLRGRVILTGVRSDVSDLLQAADAFVFPSIHEGLPVTLIEAQAAGLPCYMSDHVTDECVVTDLVTKLPISDPEVWSAKILADRDSWKRENQRDKIAESGYDITTAAARLENFYLNGESL